MKKTFAALITGVFLATGAFAAFPDKPITITVPFPPGGSTDSLARIMSHKMQEKLGQLVAALLKKRIRVFLEELSDGAKMLGIRLDRGPAGDAQ